jgi:hypothetical protein
MSRGWSIIAAARPIIGSIFSTSGHDWTPPVFGAAAYAGLVRRLPRRLRANPGHRLGIGAAHGGDRLTIEQQDGTTRQIALSEHPEIGALVDSIRATLAGDLANLTHIYTVALTGGVQDWSLSLQPRDPRLRDIVTIIRIQGEANRVRSIETVESGGDRSVMTIIPDPR